jgi:hypothetical protein
MEKERQEVADGIVDVPAGRVMKVLIVDDSALYRERLAAILAKNWAGSATTGDTFTCSGEEETLRAAVSTIEHIRSES